MNTDHSLNTGSTTNYPIICMLPSHKAQQHKIYNTVARHPDWRITKNPAALPLLAPFPQNKIISKSENSIRAGHPKIW